MPDPHDVDARYLTLQQAARRLAVHEDTLLRWHARGKLRLTRISPRAWRLARTELERYLRQQNAARG